MTASDSDLRDFAEELLKPCNLKSTIFQPVYTPFDF